MGQIAVLSCLDEDSFQKLAAHPESYKYHEVTLLSEDFNKTFQGLQFVLSKGQSAEIVDLINQLFEPSTFVGEETDYDNVDWESLVDDASLTGTAAYYHPPATVHTLAAYLSMVTDDQFKKAFDPDELNREGIYPSGAWNRKTAKNIGFNEREMLLEFHVLQHFFARASAGNYYCICEIIG